MLSDIRKILTPHDLQYCGQVQSVIVETQAGGIYRRIVKNKEQSFPLYLGASPRASVYFKSVKTLRPSAGVIL